MTPKEKAQKLFDKYFEVTNNYYKAKKCALIAVDEILSVIWINLDDEVDYWAEVKQEIEKL
jgi:hypothetical protein